MVNHKISMALLVERDSLVQERDLVMANINRLAAIKNIEAIPEFVVKFNLLAARIDTMNLAMGIASDIEDKQVGN